MAGCNHVSDWWYIWVDKQWRRDRCLDITLRVRRRDQLIVKLKVIKSRKYTFCYLSSYLHCSFFWYFVIIIFIYCIIKPPMPRLLYCIKNVCLYCHAIGLSESHWLIKALNYCNKALGGIEILSWSSLSHWVIELLSKCSVSVPNLILSKYFIDEGGIHRSLVNISYRQVDHLSKCRRRALLLHHLIDALTRSLSLLLALL